MRLPRPQRQTARSCPKLATDPDHGTWTFSLDLPSPDRHRNIVRRGGYPTAEAARAALRRMIEAQVAGFTTDPNQTVADYLATWLKDKKLTLKPTTSAGRLFCGHLAGEPLLPTQDRTAGVTHAA